jgi:hypothetical protein
LYQWGRGADGQQCRNSDTISTLSSSDQPVHGDFILSQSFPNDWLVNQNANLWQGINGVNNPCPSGYRIPTISELLDERATWSSSNISGAINSLLKLPIPGFHTYNSGSIDLINTYGFYWSSSISGAQTSYLRIRSADAISIGSIRANGYSVRCIKD